MLKVRGEKNLLFAQMFWYLSNKPKELLMYGCRLERKGIIQANIYMSESLVKSFLTYFRFGLLPVILSTEQKNWHKCYCHGWWLEGVTKTVSLKTLMKRGCGIISSKHLTDGKVHRQIILVFRSLEVTLS